MSRNIVRVTAFLVICATLNTGESDAGWRRRARHAWRDACCCPTASCGATAGTCGSVSIDCPDTQIGSVNFGGHTYNYWWCDECNCAMSTCVKITPDPHTATYTDMNPTSYDCKANCDCNASTNMWECPNDNGYCVIKSTSGGPAKSTGDRPAQVTKGTWKVGRAHTGKTGLFDFADPDTIQTTPKQGYRFEKRPGFTFMKGMTRRNAVVFVVYDDKNNPKVAIGFEQADDVGDNVPAADAIQPDAVNCKYLYETVIPVKDGTGSKIIPVTLDIFIKK